MFGHLLAPWHSARSHQILPKARAWERGFARPARCLGTSWRLGTVRDRTRSFRKLGPGSVDLLALRGVWAPLGALAQWAIALDASKSLGLGAWICSPCAEVPLHQVFSKARAWECGCARPAWSLGRTPGGGLLASLGRTRCSGTECDCMRSFPKLGRGNVVVLILRGFWAGLGAVAQCVIRPI